MTGTDLALVITASFAGVATLVTAIFAGWVAVRSLPQVHALVNKNFTEQKTEITELRTEVASLKDAALTKAEAREREV